METLLSLLQKATKINKSPILNYIANIIQDSCDNIVNDKDLYNLLINHLKSYEICNSDNEYLSLIKSIYESLINLKLIINPQNHITSVFETIAVKS